MNRIRIKIEMKFYMRICFCTSKKSSIWIIRRS